MKTALTKLALVFTGGGALTAVSAAAVHAATCICVSVDRVCVCVCIT